MKKIATIFLFLFSFGVLIAQEKCDSIYVAGFNPEQGIIGVCPCPDIGCKTIKTYNSICDHCIDTAYKDRGSMSISRYFSGGKTRDIEIIGNEGTMRIKGDGLWFNEVLISSDTAILEFMNRLLFKI